jgi:hypothetical protein
MTTGSRGHPKQRDAAIRWKRRAASGCVAGAVFFTFRF